MRLLALFPLLCSLTAFILSMLCIFAGSKPGFMENYDMMTLNTSMLGITLISNLSTPTGGTGILGTLEGDLHNLTSELENDLKGAVHSLAQALQIHDFYSYHLLDFCEGYYEPGPVHNASVDPWKNATACSNATAGFSFDPTAVIQSQLKPGVNLSDLEWPSALEDAVKVAEVAVNAMFVLYVIGVAFAGLAFLGAIGGFLSYGRLGACVDGILSFLAFLALGIASAIVSALVSNIVKAINQYGNPIGVEAYTGSGFLGMTWAATVLMLVAALAWVLDYCVGPSRRKKSYV